jgi:lipopolysaccharide export system protein LptC
MPQDGARVELGAEWGSRSRAVARPSRRYTRFVAAMKLLLPAVAVALLLLVAAWPRIQAQLERFAAVLPKLDLREARDLRMVNARFSGLDKLNRPYTVTADIARQMPSKDDLLSLEGPKADITLQSGAWIAVNSDTGIYQQQQQVLDLFGQVHVFHDAGIEFTTDSARVFMQQGTAEGTEPVAGQGRFGELDAEGFQLLDRGDRIIFTGKSRLLLVQQPPGGNS